jgi:hypothetical protein
LLVDRVEELKKSFKEFHRSEDKLKNFLKNSSISIEELTLNV